MREHKFFQCARLNQSLGGQAPLLRSWFTSLRRWFLLDCTFGAGWFGLYLSLAASLVLVFSFSIDSHNTV